MKYPFQSKPWYVLGAGAIGSLWAYHLLHRGLDVRLILRNRQRLKQWHQAGGLSVMGSGDNHDTEQASGQPLSCPVSLAAALDTPIEQIIISCKAQQTLDAMAGITHTLAHGATVILLQNGMGVADQLQRLRPDLLLHCAITTSGAHLQAPFCVQPAGRGLTQIGRYPRETDTSAELSKQIIAILTNDCLPISPCDDIFSAQWKKLAVNCVINPLTALYDLPNGQLLNQPQASTEAVALCREISAISDALTIAITPAQLWANVNAICQQTANNISSMLQDIRAERRTEIDYINGYLQRQGRRYRVPCPMNDDVLRRIHALQER